MHVFPSDATTDGSSNAPTLAHRARRMLHWPAALALLLVMIAWSPPSQAAPQTPPEGGHDLVAEWTGTDAAVRVVAGPDGLIHVLGGVYVRHMRPDGSIDGSTRVENIKELAVGPTGDLFGAKEREVMQLALQGLPACCKAWAGVAPATSASISRNDRRRAASSQAASVAGMATRVNSRTAE